jgi:hypothetical protein
MALEEDTEGADERTPEQAVVEDRRLQEQLKRRQELQELHALFDLEPFRDFYWRLMERCNVNQKVYSRNFGDMALEEGKRQVGLWLLTEVSAANPDALVTMMLKNARRVQEEELGAAEKPPLRQT